MAGRSEAVPHAEVIGGVARTGFAVIADSVSGAILVADLRVGSVQVGVLRQRIRIRHAQLGRILVEGGAVVLADVRGQDGAAHRRDRCADRSPRLGAHQASLQGRGGQEGQGRAPTMTLTHHDGMDIEELDPALVGTEPFDRLTGMKAFVVGNARTILHTTRQLISPLVQYPPKLWELFHSFGLTTLELNPIRMRADSKGCLTPVACDFKCGFDRDDPRWARLDRPGQLFAADYSDFEQEINQLRHLPGPGPNLTRGMGVTLCGPIGTHGTAYARR